MTDTTQPFRSGFVTFVGRPNVGKSTLTNALVGEKIAITSAKPQTTRRAIRGVVTTPMGQLAIVDTPGIHRPRTLLGSRLNTVVEDVLGEVDVIGFCIPASETIGPGDRFIVEQITKYPHARLVALVTKIDSSKGPAIAEQLLAVSKLADWAEIIPVSGRTGAQIELVRDQLIGLLPEGPMMYPDDVITEESDVTRIAEFIREASLSKSREELPHSIAVTIDEVQEDGKATRGFSSEGDLQSLIVAVGGEAEAEAEAEADEVADSTHDEVASDGGSSVDGATEDGAARNDALLGPKRTVFATIWVERDSQKAIIIGHKGSRLAEIRRGAVREVRYHLGYEIELRLHVSVAKNWQSDPKQLGKLGF